MVAYDARLWRPLLLKSMELKVPFFVNDTPIVDDGFQMDTISDTLTNDKNYLHQKPFLRPN